MSEGFADVLVAVVLGAVVAGAFAFGRIAPGWSPEEACSRMRRA